MADLATGLEDDDDEEDDSHMQAVAAEDGVCRFRIPEWTGCSSCSPSSLLCVDSHKLEAAKVDATAAAAVALTRDRASPSMYWDAMLAM